MALIKCGECSAEISDKAAACPRCGAPVVVKPQLTAPKNNWILGAVILATVGGAAIWLKSPQPSSEQPAAKAAPVPACAAQDLDCQGNKGVTSASVFCKDPIERMAKHSVKWTDGTFEMKMSRFRWTSKPGGTITYIGDKVEFQNGYGAFTPMIYECEMADDRKTVLNVRMREGRLPAN